VPDSTRPRDEKSSSPVTSVALGVRRQRWWRVRHEKIAVCHAAAEVIERSDGRRVVDRDDGQPPEREQRLWMLAVCAGKHRAPDEVLLAERDAVVRAAIDHEQIAGLEQRFGDRVLRAGDVMRIGRDVDRRRRPHKTATSRRGERPLGRL